MTPAPAPRHSSRAQREQTLGRNVARLLRGAWRDTNESSRFEFPGSKSKLETRNSKLETLSEAELTEITPILCRNGSGALAWYKIQNTPLANTAAGEQLHEVYRRFRLAALVHEREIAYVFSLLRAAGIEAVLVKGWAIARRYPDRALRPYGDIDICVAPRQFAEAQRALRCLESIEGHHVDLHAGFAEVGRTKAVQSPKSKVQSPPGLDRLWTLDIGLWTKSVECGGEPVRILSDEDHLRILSLHLLRSGAWRPVWLCDIALLLESQVQSPKSNVQSLFGVDRLWTLDIGHWTATTMALAYELLGAEIPEGVQSPLPRWLVPAVLKQWGGERAGGSRQEAVGSKTERVQSPTSTNDGRRTTDDGGRFISMVPVIGRRSSVSLLDLGLWTSLYSRWNNPIRATAAVGGEFNNWPRLPYRVAESIMRLRELPGKIRGQRTENRGQRTEGRGQRTENRSQDRSCLPIAFSDF